MLSWPVVVVQLVIGVEANCGGGQWRLELVGNN